MDNQLINKIETQGLDLTKHLLDHLHEDGLIRGELSSSALSTAVAVFTLYLHSEKKHASQIEKGILWLAENVNPDNAWGDTNRSKSNLSTTILCMSAIATIHSRKHPLFEKAKTYVEKQSASLSPKDISAAIQAVYGKDKTFSAPILTMAALSDFYEKGDDAWKYVPQLPFEIALFPEKLLKAFKISVVSYALPALISIGLVRHKHRRGVNLVLNSIRELLLDKVLKKLKSIQPAHGGFLEAIPLTAFTMMSLIRTGVEDEDLIKKSIDFLLARQRNDGSWPIATDVALWTTTLSVNAIFSGNASKAIDEITSKKIKEKILDMQHQKIHPFTSAAPYAWLWTDLPGGVPDADDTSGALTALWRLSADDLPAVTLGLEWLVNLQNNDGGIPTFCRGWGKLPFDKSCPDITAHALTAFALWEPSVDNAFRGKLKKSTSKSIHYLLRTQNRDGSWNPLWFGNENQKDHQNLVYGTSKVLEGLFQARQTTDIIVMPAIEAGMKFLCSSQNSDGGWGAGKDLPSTIEETSIALAAVCLFSENEVFAEKGALWLVKHLESNKKYYATPIGLYFESLWYYEKLYPVIFSLKALLNMKMFQKS